MVELQDAALDATLDATLLGFILFMFFGIIFVLLAFYVLKSKGLSTMAELQGLDKPWLAWIPIVNFYLIGELVSDTKDGTKGKKYVTLIAISFIFYLVMSIIIDVTLSGYSPIEDSAIPLPELTFFILSTLFYAVISLTIYYKLLRKYTTHAKLLLVLSIFLSSIVTDIAFYVIRKNPIRYENGRYLTDDEIRERELEEEELEDEELEDEDSTIGEEKDRVD